MSAGGGAMTVSVRLFAILREHAGTEAVTVQLARGATAKDAIGALSAHAGLEGVLGRLPVCLAVNREFADEATELHEGDELALVPPLSGGAEGAGAAGTVPVHVRVDDGPISVERVSGLVADPRAGAIVVFAGVPREVPALEYEAYREMAEERLADIVHGSLGAHELCAAAAEHRTGVVPTGEPSVVVAVSAPHRAEAFAAAREAIDRIKAELPVFKRELRGDGSREWVAGVPAAPRAGLDAATASDPEPRLTHVAPDGSARMVDVGAKAPALRVARARARLRMAPATARAVQRGDGPKGEVLGVARIAGIQAAKQTPALIPLAHPLALTFVDVTAEVDPAAGLVELQGEARTVASTGVEMEAITAAAVAALTVYDMVKGIERGVTIERVELLEKRGGQGGPWVRDD